MSKTINDIKQVTVAGAGTLGLRISLRCALDGYQVTLFDINADQLAVAQDFQAKLSADFLKKGMIDASMVERAKSGLRVTTDIEEATANADLVSETVIENIDIKRDFYTDFAPRLKPSTILTSNTSYLLASDLVDSVVEPQNFCTFHFHDVFNQTVVDVMPHATTSQSVVDLLMEFGKRINQIPVFIRKESPGYIFNSILSAILGQSGSLLINGVGSIQDIDRSFMGNFKQSVGPFGMLDHIGLDTALHITGAQSDARSQKFADLLRGYVEQGKLGYKTGEGFYKYPNPEYANPDFLNG